MADPKKALPGNAPGDFFVDSSCIGCHNCSDLAPDIFGEVEDHFYLVVKRQPANEDEIHRTLQALVCCPKGSIGIIGSRGTRARYDIKSIIEEFPLEISKDVYYLGFNSDKSAGAKSFFIASEGGNWMVEAPKFQERTLKWIESRGGLSHIFLSHRDDVAQADLFAGYFKAKRIIHQDDLEAQPGAEIVINGLEPVAFGDDFLVIPTPGHTMGHCVLLHKETHLFTGDMLTSKERFGDPIEAWKPELCWWSWERQTESIGKLINYSFTVMIPSHGRIWRDTSANMTEHLRRCVERCHSETDTNLR
ncbi:MAG: ferredoxin [Candidatus Obscuribacterales bacterium]|nr:ferredoxin [Candidatus Obscuribacterales bacterium]